MAAETSIQVLEGATVDITPTGARGRRRYVYYLASGWIGLVLLLTLIVDLLPLKGYDVSGDEFRLHPGWRFHEPLGTDKIGRSMLSRLIYGTRASLLLALLSVAIAMGFALIIGVTAGYAKGLFGRVFDLVTDAILAFPPILFLLVLSAVMRPGFRTLSISLVVLAFPNLARVVRANTLTFASREFILAARAMGATKRRIIFRELMPNVALPAMSVSFLSVANLITAEGSLSFIGRGIPAPTPSLKPPLAP